MGRTMLVHGLHEVQRLYRGHSTHARSVMIEVRWLSLAARSHSAACVWANRRVARWGRRCTVATETMQ